MHPLQLLAWSEGGPARDLAHCEVTVENLGKEINCLGLTLQKRITISTLSPRAGPSTVNICP